MSGIGEFLIRQISVWDGGSSCSSSGHSSVSPIFPSGSEMCSQLGKVGESMGLRGLHTFSCVS